jgi:hypothetical protein
MSEFPCRAGNFQAISCRRASSSAAAPAADGVASRGHTPSAQHRLGSSRNFREFFRSVGEFRKAAQGLLRQSCAPCDSHTSHCNTALLGHHRDSGARFGVKTGTNLHHLDRRPAIRYFRTHDVSLRISIGPARGSSGAREHPPCPSGSLRARSEHADVRSPDAVIQAFIADRVLPALRLADLAEQLLRPAAPRLAASRTRDGSWRSGHGAGHGGARSQLRERGHWRTAYWHGIFETRTALTGKRHPVSRPARSKAKPAPRPRR